MEFPTDMDVIIDDGMEPNQTNKGQGSISPSNNGKQPQITITLTSNGGARVTDVGGSEYVVDRETLVNSNIDTNDMSQQAVDTLLNMTIYDQARRFSVASENTDNSTSQPDVGRGMPKISNKRMRRMTAAAAGTHRKRRIKDEAEETSAATNNKNARSEKKEAVPIPDLCPPPPPSLFGKIAVAGNEKEALTNMLMSWYMSGYHTGFYQGVMHEKMSNQKPK